MIGTLKSEFFKTEKIFDRAYMSYLERLLLAGEEIIMSLPIFRSCEVIAWFTDRRIIFTSSPADINIKGEITEVEFLPYKSIQRYSFMGANNNEEYKINIFLSDKIDFAFFADNIDDAKTILKFIGEKCGC